MTEPAVAILIPTFRRPDGLARLLASLDRLTFTGGRAPRISIVVVDNDADIAPARGDGLARASRHPLDYVVEPVRGLSAARNRALEQVPADTRFIAFIDDDEWAEPQWLDALLAVQAETGAEVVQGPVTPEFARPAPAWMTIGGYFEVGPFEAGDRLDFGASGNCLIDWPKLAASGVRFDMAYNTSGGEDADFFERLLALGWSIAAAPDARAHELVPLERMTPAGVRRLEFRKGNTLGRLALRSGAPRRIAERAIKGVGHIAYGATEAVAFGLLVDGAAARGMARVARGAGMLAAFLRLRSHYYGGRPSPHPGRAAGPV